MDDYTKRSKIKIEEILIELKIVEERMKKAKVTNDKVGYEIALRKHEEIYSEYGHLIYKKTKPTAVFEKRL